MMSQDVPHLYTSAYKAATAYTDTGPHDSNDLPVVICLHGVLTSSYLYRAVGEQLTPAARVICPDLPGFGESQKKPKWPLRFHHYANWLDEFISTVVGKNKAIHLVVHDFSGPIGLHWAIQNSQRVKSLLILNTTVFLEHFRPPITAIAGTTLLVGPKLVQHGMRAPLVKHSMQKELHTPASQATASTYGEPYEETRSRIAIADIVRGCRTAPWFITKVRRSLKSIESPCTVMFGAEDKHCSPTNGEAFTQRIAGAQWRLLSGIGHFVPEEAPETVAAEIASLCHRAGEPLNNLARIHAV